MKPLIDLLITVLLPSLPGFFLIYALFGGRKKFFMMSVSLAFPAGAGLLSVIMLGMSVFRMEFGFLPITSVLLAVSGAGYFFIRKIPADSNSACDRIAAPAPAPAPAPGIAQIMTAGLLSLYVLWCVFYIFWNTTNIPVYAWDSIGFITLKAKIFYFDRSILSVVNTTHASYPLLVPLAQTWSAIVHGSWDDQMVQNIFPVVFLSFLAFSWIFMERSRGKPAAMLLIFILCSANLTLVHATIAYRDLFLMFYASAAVMLISVYGRERDDSYLWAASILAGAGANTKMEGVGFLAVFSLLLVLAVPDLWKAPKTLVNKLLKLNIPALALAAPFMAYKLGFGINSEDYRRFDFTFDKISRIPEILSAMSAETLFGGNWNITWFLGIVFCVIAARDIVRKYELRFFFMAAVIFFGFFFAQGLFTSNFTWLGGDGTLTTIGRVILQFYPVGAVLLTLLLKEALERPGK